jgi:hypothetical protein
MNSFLMKRYHNLRLSNMDLKDKHNGELESLRQRYSNQIKSVKKQLEIEEARLRSRQSAELNSVQRKEMVKPK